MFLYQIFLAVIFVVGSVAFTSCKKIEAEDIVVLQQMSPTMEMVAQSNQGMKKVDSLTLKNNKDREVRQYYYCINYHDELNTSKQDSCKPANPIELEKRFLKYVNFDNVRFNIVVLQEGFHREYFFYEESSASKKIVYIQTYGVDQWIGLPRHAISKTLSDTEKYEIESLFMAAAQSIENSASYGPRILLEWKSGVGIEKRCHNMNSGKSKDVLHWLENKLRLAKRAAVDQYADTSEFN